MSDSDDGATRTDDDALDHAEDEEPHEPETSARESERNLAASVAKPPTIEADVTDTAPPSWREDIGRVLEDRYALIEVIGSGGHGDVWVASDLILHERVALKWMRVVRGAMLARIRREITTLRMLRFPGVVRLIDDGIVDERPFLVMELVEGRPFPGSKPEGASRRFAWRDLAGPTLALLETLAHVHAAGVVHRDLKPENVLVRPDGRPVVLDFGISQLQAAGFDRVTGGGQLVGTPLYAAPEQILGRDVDARTDLYAVGVMLYEALTGQAPHAACDLPSMLRSRLVQPAPHVQELAPELPPRVASVIDRLLAVRIEHRFGSAREVLAALRGEVTNAPARLPWLGSRMPVLTLVEAAGACRSMDLVGAQGTGRSRCLQEVAEALGAKGFSIGWTRPSRAPLGSLLPLLGEPPSDVEDELERVLAWADEALAKMLKGGTLLFADDAEGLDPWSAKILARRREAGDGVILRAFVSRPPHVSGMAPEDVVEVLPLAQTALLPLFAGPDRLFHLREDAARALWARTDGLSARIEVELLTWARLGLARREGPLYTIHREGLDQLEAGLMSIPVATSAAAYFEGSPHIEQVHRWLSIAGCPMRLSQLAILTEDARWRVEAACIALESVGAVRRLEADTFEARSHAHLPWNDQQRVEAHRAMAAVLAPGSEGRLHHLLAAGLGREAAHEAVLEAERFARRGDLGAATLVLAEGLRAARQQGAGSEHAQAQILKTWAKVAFAGYTPRALDRVLYELTRARIHHEELRQLESLLRAALTAPGAGGLSAIEQAEAIEPFSDPELERRRHRVRITAVAARASPSLIADVLEQVELWMEESDEPLAHLCLTEGRALQRYHEGRYAEAASLHAEAATLEPWTTGRMSFILNSASALMEAFRHTEAAERAAEALALAADCRNPYWEGRAEWLVRSAHYRLGQTAGVDWELVGAVARVGALDLEALVYFTEAAVARCAGAWADGATLAERAARIWHGMNRPTATMLARALAIACGAVPGVGEVDALVERAMGRTGTGLGIQTLGLIGGVYPEMRARWQHAIPELVRGIPNEHWDQRMDVLSVNEALRGAMVAPA